MAYTDGLLAEGERVIVRAHRHPLFLAGHVALYLLIGIVAIGVGVWLASAVSIYVGIALWVISLLPIGLALIRFLAWRNEEYAVTNYRIIQSEGILNKRILDSSLEKVNDILLTQSLVGRLLDYGTVQIITGSDVGINRLDALQDPFGFKRAIVDARNDLYDQDRDDLPMHQGARQRLLDALTELRDTGVLSDAEYESKRDRLLGSSPTQR